MEEKGQDVDGNKNGVKERNRTEIRKKSGRR